MASQHVETGSADRPYIGSTNNEWLQPGDVIVPGEADRCPELFDICGTWTVTAVDFAPQGPCCLRVGHMSITTDRDLRRHVRRDQPVKIVAPDRYWRLANICHRYGWHLRRSSAQRSWFASQIGADGVYRRLWPTADNPYCAPGKTWVWGASHNGSHLGSGTDTLAGCWSAVNRCAPTGHQNTDHPTTKKGTS
jgi:hypothetical protein